MCSLDEQEREQEKDAGSLVPEQRGDMWAGDRPGEMAAFVWWERTLGTRRADFSFGHGRCCACQDGLFKGPQKDVLF